ncbi:choline transporter [Aspergillus pseudonomiae]|uniref:Choline transporter n=1 Tax=Aspergillus pseudonomiae TaxID=1506151 RepID=A0A5N7D5B5_9EURO|nr:choline transporter [Aspergillus pseudonomiae]KAB8262170.1 choline transporter [Aspergillus pseudonomiae]KAE8401602.1 choline transporter [Aspergillus pseudonomiae]
MAVMLDKPIKGQPRAADDQSIIPGTVTDISKDADDDDAILRANGHQTAMPRQFNWLSALGLGFSITNSWVGYLSCFGQNLTYGGAQTCIFSLIVAFIVQFIVTLGLAELGSAFPSSGGQYHFCYILSPERTRRYSAYIVGWLSVLAWWIVTCSGISLATVVLNGIVHFCSPGYIANQWQTYLTYVGVSVVTIIPVFAASNRISLVTQVAFYLSLSGFVIFLVVSIVMHQHMQPQSFLLQSGQGNSGWNEGTAWLLSISNAMYAFGGVDGVIHICEEIPKPGKRVPQIMVMTMMIGLLTCLPVFIVFMYFTIDMEAVREAPLPSLELVYQITGSRSVTLGLFILLWVIYAFSLPSQWVSGGRVAWAFARDRGTPFSEYFSKINDRFNFPVRTTVVAFLFSCLYGLLYLASTTAFNSIITSAVLFLNITYTIPQGILLTQGRTCLPKRYLKLGWVGYFCNAFSVLWIVVLGVLICMPPNLPVSLQSMNYVCIILLGVFTLINTLWLFVGRRSFEGPHIDWNLVRSITN